jgi:hypothetical protein
MSLADVDDESLNALIQHFVPSQPTLAREEYLRVFLLISQELQKIEEKGGQNTRFLFNSLLRAEKGRIFVKPLPSLTEIDANSDFKDILGEEFYRKLINYGSNGLLFEKMEENPQKSYSFFHWIENKIEIGINEEGDGLYLQLLKRVWMFRFIEALETLEKIRISYPEDEEVPTIAIGLGFFR